MAARVDNTGLFYWAELRHVTFFDGARRRLVPASPVILLGAFTRWISTPSHFWFAHDGLVPTPIPGDQEHPRAAHQWPKYQEEPNGSQVSSDKDGKAAFGSQGCLGTASEFEDPLRFAAKWTAIHRVDYWGTGVPVGERCVAAMALPPQLGPMCSKPLLGFRKCREYQAHRLPKRPAMMWVQAMGQLVDDYIVDDGEGGLDEAPV